MAFGLPPAAHIVPASHLSTICWEGLGFRERFGRYRAIDQMHHHSQPYAAPHGRGYIQPLNQISTCRRLPAREQCRSQMVVMPPDPDETVIASET